MFALSLARGGDAETRLRGTVESRRLVRVLAVAQFFDQPAADGTEIGRRIAELGGEPIGDRRIIGGGAREGLGGQLPAQRQCGHAAVPGEFVEHQIVIARLDDDRDVAVVLGGGADHRRPPDIDILDAIVEAGAARRRFLKRIEIDYHEIDRLDAMRPHCLDMRRVAANGEQAAMHGRMQRLDPAVHHFRKAGDVGYFGDGEAGSGQRHSCAAGRNELDAVVGQRARKLDQAGFVGNGNKGAGGTP